MSSLFVVLILCAAVCNALLPSLVVQQLGIILLFHLTASLPVSQMQALEKLYNYTDGPHWSIPGTGAGTAWNFSTTATGVYLMDPCNKWYGVICQNSTVVRLILESSSLSGNIPSDLKMLTSLEILALDSNSLSGTIPSELGILSYLQILYLNSNSLSGTIPSELGLIKRMQTLVLCNNKLTGTISSEFGLLTGLQGLYLFSNGLEGSIPSELGLLTGLTNLNFNTNNFVGTLPAVLGRLTRLQILYLYSNSFVGSLPSELGLLTGLTDLELYSNSLVGSLPSVLGLLTGLKALYLYSNSLTGTIPSELGKLTGLQQLYLYSNSIVGSLPTEFGHLTALELLVLFRNNIFGSIPSELGLLTGLRELWLNQNCLVGSLPSELGLLSRLGTLDLYSNSLFGSLPTELGLLTGLQSLWLWGNVLEGTLPTELGLMTALTMLYMSQNSFVGTIPSELGKLTGLKALFLSFNKLTGSLTSELWLLTRLTTLVLASNSLQGSVPTELSRLTGIQGLRLDRNMLTGSLTTELGQLTGLQILQLNNNKLVGSLPSQLGLLTGLNQLFLSDNSLVGELPSELGLMTGMQIMLLFANDLSGSLPSEIGRLKELQIADLGINKFSGSIIEQFFAMEKLTVLSLSHNKLQGQLLSKIPSSLQILDLSDNCFTGTLASSLCDATSLQFLVLDCLSSGCITDIWPRNNIFGFNAYRLTAQMSGSIPACIYSMPNLKTLHISGNGLFGSLSAGPAGWPINLTDLSLSHNALTGELPLSLRLRSQQLSTFDLSYNRLDGTLDSFQPNSNLSSNFSFAVNRLSGKIPSAVTRLKSAVNILQNNMFECSWLDRDASLPPTDPAYTEYSCGSHAIDVYIYIFALFVALFSFWLLAFRWRSMLFWLASRNKASLEALQKRPVPIQAVLYRVRGLALRAGAALLLVFLPLYGTLKPFFGTYTFQYSWTVAAIMLSGATPAAVLLAFWTLALTVASASILVCFRDLKGLTTMVDAGPATFGARNSPTFSEQCRLAIRLAIVVTLNVGIAGAANIAFVVVTVGSYTNTDKSLATVALGLYKTAWDTILPTIINCKALLLGVDRAVEERSKLKAGDLFCTFLLIVNTIVMPALAVAVTDPSCFKSLLLSAPDIVGGWSTEISIPPNPVSPELFLPLSSSSGLRAPFSYNYECTITLVEKFAPVFAQVALTSAFVSPLLAAISRWALDSMQSCSVGDRIPGPRRFLLAMLRSFLLGMLPSMLLFRKSERSSEDSKNFIKADEVLRQTLSEVSLLMSIGLLVPPLGVLFAASIISRCLMWEFLIDRFLSLPQEHLEGDIQALEQQSLHLGSLGRTALYNARWLLTIFPALFLALFLADIAGDAAGIENALWAPILMALLPPVALFVLTRLLPRALSERFELSDVKESVFALSQITIEAAEGNPIHATLSEPRDHASGRIVERDRATEDEGGIEGDRCEPLEVSALCDPIPEPAEQPHPQPQSQSQSQHWFVKPPKRL